MRLIVWTRKFLHERGDYYICKIYQDLGDKSQMLAQRDIDRTAENFVSGQFQFITDSNVVTFYEHGHPVLEYHLTRSLPLVAGRNAGEVRSMLKNPTRNQRRKGTAPPVLELGIKPEVIPRVAQPHGSGGNDMKNPSSRTMKRFVKDKFIEQLANATKTFDLKQFLPLALLCIVMGLTVGYVLSILYHPNLVSAPPSGYQYIIQKVNATVTAVHTSTIGAP